MSDDQSEAFATAAKWGELLLRHIVPICERDMRGHTQGHGTGLLVSHRTRNFLVTASHVLKPLEEQRRLFYPCDRKTERNIGGRILRTINNPIPGHAYDLDIAVVLLEGDGQPPYPELNTFCLPMDSLQSNALPRHGKSYFAVGYPATKTFTHVKNQEVEARPFGHWCGSIPDSDYDSLNLSADRCLALEFNVKKVHSSPSKIQQAPDPQGMSGAPIWLLFDRDGENDATKNTVLGILTEHRRSEKLLVGTDIDVAIDMINKLSSE